MTLHICPFACSRCDLTCPCECRAVVLEEYDADGQLAYSETVHVHEVDQ